MWSLRPIAFNDMAGWAGDDHRAALAALARHTEKPVVETYRTGRLGIPPKTLMELATEAAEPDARTDPRGFFESRFVPVRLDPGPGERGLVTGFYEPELSASRICTSSFAVPFLRRPPDLVPVDDNNRPSGFDPEMRFARRTDDGALTEHHDRAAIEAGALDGQNLEIAYVTDPVDAFFVHIQGAASLTFDDGSATRITYDGKTGHPFTAIGALLVARGEIAAEAISMQSIRAWLASHPDKAAGLMAENRSYIFFKETPPGQPGDGPIAAAKVPLTAGRSLAVDRLLHTFGTPIFVDAERDEGVPFRRLMIAQETGSAIVGPARGDIFFGTGAEAGEAAGGVKSPCTFTILVPRDMVDRLPEEWAP
ncbi:MAG: MltA domain-containing protein [Phyllobacteriaceae bacterium]|jgi:membrane-bound lytic murein transglycosylase A|nr:MltA domain-containing protein [Phyllobacteriaceae bacterium]